MTSEPPRLWYDAMRLHQDSLTRTLTLLQNGSVEKAMRRMEERQAEIHRMFENSLVGHYSELFKAAQQLCDLSLRTSFTENSIVQAHASWFSELDRIATPPERLEGIARLALTDFGYDVSITESFLSQFNYDTLANQLDAQLSVTSNVQNAISTLESSYRALVESFPSLDDFVQLPFFVLPDATQGLVVKGRVLASLQPSPVLASENAPPEPEIIHEDDEGTVCLFSLLEDIDPGLVPIYTGALESLDGTNPDRERHVLTSLRTLWDEVFRLMAPDGAVSAWAEAHAVPREEYIHKARPTRRARIAYILRSVNNSPITQYVDANVKAALKLHELFQRVHNTSVGLTQQQLRVLVLDTRMSLEYFIRVWQW